MWLLEEIIRSPEGDTNVPIGNYLSQYFSNLYLAGFDHWIKETCGMKYYIRYCDDGIILHHDKDYLKNLLVKIDGYLTAIGLTLNPKTKIINVDKCGIDFLGYIHHRGYTLLRKSSSRKFKRKMKQIRTYSDQMDSQHVLSSVMSYTGWLQHCDSHNLLNSYIHTPLIHSILETSSNSLGIQNQMGKYHGRIDN
jgi:hypothetical protein